MILKHERNSSVELLKIFAMLLIALCHAVPTSPIIYNGITYISGNPTAIPVLFFVDCFDGIGLIGDVIFIVCSSYFLLDSKKFKVSKVAAMIINSFIISIIFLIVILSLGFKLSALETVKQFFPTVFQNNWFVAYYIIFYLLHPLLNKIIYSLNKQCLAIAAVLLFVHCYILLFIQFEAPGINKLICFIAIYFITAYVKLYGKDIAENRKLNIAICIISAVLYCIMKVAINQIGLNSEFFNGKTVVIFHINNPIILCFSLSLFNIANTRNFVSKPINYISSLSLLFYLIHHNNLASKYIQPLWHEWFAETFGGQYLLCGIVLLFLILSVGGLLLSALYKQTIDKLTVLLSEKVQRLCDGISEKFANKNSKQL